MKLFEKLKNALFEEEYVEVEEPKKKEKPIAKKIEPPQKKVEPVEEKIEEEKLPDEMSDRALSKADGFKFPMDFEEEDFIEETKVEVEPEVKPYEPEVKTPNYVKEIPVTHEYAPYEKREEKKGFRPSPIISPIYGILDQNYKKEDIVTKKDVRITSSYSTSRLDFDAVREKAYGDLSSDIGISMTKEPITVKEEPKEEEVQLEDNLLVDMRDEDTTPTVEKVTMGDAEEYFQDLGLEYNIDYKDASQEKATGRRATKNKEKEAEIEKTDEQSTQLEDNLFDLIDSMYDEER